MLACKNCLYLYGRYFKNTSFVFCRRTVINHSRSCNFLVNTNHRSMVATQRVCFSNGSQTSGTNQSGSSTTDHGQSASEQEGCGQSDEATYDDVRKKILEHALNHVVDHGWSRRSLSLGAEEAGYAGVAEGMFDESDLVLYFVQDSNEKLLKHLQENACKYRDGRGRSKLIRDAMEFRLRLIIPYISMWPNAMQMLLNPKVFSQGANELGHMVDDIWHHAGDQSADFNWYTKRAMLAKLYTSTQLYMLNDQSPDFADTWEFLDRRFADLKTFGRVTRGLQETCDGIFDVAFSGFAVMRNVVGIPRRYR